MLPLHFYAYSLHFHAPSYSFVLFPVTLLSTPVTLLQPVPTSWPHMICYTASHSRPPASYNVVLPVVDATDSSLLQSSTCQNGHTRTHTCTHTQIHTHTHTHTHMHTHHWWTGHLFDSLNLFTNCTVVRFSTVPLSIVGGDLCQVVTFVRWMTVSYPQPIDKLHSFHLTLVMLTTQPGHLSSLLHPC